MHVLGFGTYDTTYHPRAAILLHGLADLGVEVSEFNVPLRLSTRERVEMMRKPWLVGHLLSRICAAWGRLVVKRLRVTARPGDIGVKRPKWTHPDVLLVGYMGHFDVLLARLLFPRTVIALDMLIFARDTAVDRGETSRLKLALLDLLDRLAISISDLVVVDTAESAALVRSRRRTKVVVAPVGAAPEWFNHGPPDRDGRSDRTNALSVVFFGLYTPLQGTSTIGSAISRLVELPITFTMIGTGQDYAKTRELANEAESVTWADWVSAAQLPELVSQFDVCLGIFGDTPKARRVVPNKVFEGAAAGCMIVTSDTTPQRRLVGNAATYVPPADSDALAEILAWLSRHPDEVAKRRALARAHAEANFQAEQIAVPLFLTLKESLNA